MGLINSQEDENIQIAKEMLSLGLDIDQICEVTKLSKEQVEEIAKKGNNIN